MDELVGISDFARQVDMSIDTFQRRRRDDAEFPAPESEGVSPRGRKVLLYRVSSLTEYITRKPVAPGGSKWKRKQAARPKSPLAELDTCVRGNLPGHWFAGACR